MAKTKGVKVIAQRLTKYFPNKFANYTSALPEARRVFAQIQDEGEKVNNKNIFSKIRSPRISKAEQLNKMVGLENMKKMIDPIEYYNINEADYPTSMKKLPKNLLFISDLFPDTVKQPLPGGADYSYKDLFAPYVAFCDKQRADTEDKSRYEIDWFVTWTVPIPNKKKSGEFISEFISIDANGNPVDYGFNPKNITQAPTTQILSEGEKPEKKVEQPTTTTTDRPTGLTSEQEFLLKMEQQKERNAIAKKELVDSMTRAGAPWSDIKAELDKM